MNRAYCENLLEVKKDIYNNVEFEYMICFYCGHEHLTEDQEKEYSRKINENNG